MGPTPPLNVRSDASGLRSHCRVSAIYGKGERRMVACCICCKVLANEKIGNIWHVFFLIGWSLAQSKMEKWPWLDRLAALLSNAYPVQRNVLSCVGYLVIAYKNKEPTISPWWRHQMKTSSALLAICAGMSPPVNSPHKGQWSGALMFPSICAWINGCVNNREAGDLRRHRAHYDVTIMFGLRYAFRLRFRL